MTRKMNNQGQSLLEVILALAIFALISVTLVTMATGGLASLDQGGRQIEAGALAQEGMEAVRAVRDRAWNELVFTTSTVTTTGGQWVLGGEDASATIGDYTRVINFENICRGAGNNITTCPGAYGDAHSKKVTSEVFWSPRVGVTTSIKLVSYLTNWDTNIWTQTDWVGGMGQNIWSDIAKFFSNDGGIDASAAGQLQLLYSSNGGCGPMVWDFSHPSNYAFDSSQIEVVGGLGQLKDTGSCIGPAKTCSGLASQSVCQTTTGCKWRSDFSKDDPTINNSHSYNPTQMAYWSGFMETAVKNGGQVYYQLSSDDGASWKYWNGSTWATSTLGNQYNIADVINANIATFSTSTRKIMFKAILSGNGNQQVKLDQVQIDCTRQTDWDFEVPSDYIYDTAALSVSAGSVSLKDLGGVGSCLGTTSTCATFVSSSTCQDQSDCLWQVSAPYYSTSSPSVSPLSSLSVSTATFYGWTGMVETATKNGGEIYYQLSNDDGASWKYWNGSTWAGANPGDYNTAAIINTNIGTLSTSTGQLSFKAFLASNGVQPMQLDNITVTWMENVGSSGYATLGTIISSAFNLSNPSPVSVISWTQDTSTCSNCGVKLQVRTAPNSSGHPGVWSPWYGALGAGSYFTTPSGTLISKNLNWNQWAQYRVQLTGDSNTTPILKDVFIYYK